MSPDLALALALADAADALSLPRFRSGLVVETKPDLTPVTAADRSVEAELRRILADERPDDAILGEEQGAEGVGARRWLVDPIDGTRNYSRGIPVWATLIALEVNGVVQLGVVSAPALASRWWAERGAGAFANWGQIHVSAEGSVDGAMDGPGVKEWDLAAMQVIIEEAGGRFSDFTGATRIDSGSAIASNGLIHDELLAAVVEG